MTPSRYFIPLLGISQIVSWGTLYYSLAVLAQPIALETSWNSLLIYSAFSISLFISGLAAPAVGKWIDRTGGRHTMSLGSVLSAMALVMLAFAQSPVLYVLGWCLIGLSMSMSLYEAAFSATHQIMPQNFRRNITLLTLFGGLASTVFWPITQFLNEWIGWRNTLIIFASLQLFITLPIHWFLLPSTPLSSRPYPAKNSRKLNHYPNSFLWLMLSFAIISAIFSALSVFIIDALEHGGFDRNQAVWLAALIGPTQVIGRLIELYFARQIRVYIMGLIAFSALTLSLFFLNILSHSDYLALLFVIFYGLANGVLTIVRAALPVELYGREHVGLLLGQLALPAFISKAIMPGFFAFLLMLGMDFQLGLWGLFFLSAAALLFYILIQYTQERPPLA